jgi:DNA repair protein RadC
LPSRADIEMTKEVKDACDKLEIVLPDHIVVSRSGNNSLRPWGYFNE